MLFYTVTEQRGLVLLWLTHIDYCCIGPPCWPACHQAAQSCSVWLRQGNISWGNDQTCQGAETGVDVGWRSCVNLCFLCLQERGSSAQRLRDQAAMMGLRRLHSRRGGRNGGGAPRGHPSRRDGKVLINFGLQSAEPRRKLDFFLFFFHLQCSKLLHENAY